MDVPLWLPVKPICNNICDQPSCPGQAQGTAPTDGDSQGEVFDCRRGAGLSPPSSSCQRPWAASLPTPLREMSSPKYLPLKDGRRPPIFTPYTDVGHYNRSIASPKLKKRYCSRIAS